MPGIANSVHSKLDLLQWIRQLLNNESEDAIGRERQILPKTSPVDDDLHQSSCEYPDIAFEHAGSKDDYTYVVNRDNSRSTH